MGRFPQQTQREGAVPAACAGAAGGGGDAADAAFEALRAAARPSPHGPASLSDADFEQLLAELKGLEGRAPRISRGGSEETAAREPFCSARGQRAKGPSHNERRKPRRQDESTATDGHHRAQRTDIGIVHVAEGLERLHGKLAQAAGGEPASLPPGTLDELARLALSLRVLSLKGEPDAVLIAAAGGWRFALPLAAVEELRAADERPQGLATLDPRAWWEGGSADPAPDAADARYWVIAAAGARRAALAVSALHGVCLAPAAPPGPMLAGMRSIAGIVRDTQGVPAVLVRLEEILASEDAPLAGNRAPAIDC